MLIQILGATRWEISIRRPSTNARRLIRIVFSNFITLQHLSAGLSVPYRNDACQWKFIRTPRRISGHVETTLHSIARTRSCGRNTRYECDDSPSQYSTSYFEDTVRLLTLRTQYEYIFEMVAHGFGISHTQCGYSTRIVQNRSRLTRVHHPNLCVPIIVSCIGPHGPHHASLSYWSDCGLVTSLTSFV